MRGLLLACVLLAAVAAPARSQDPLEALRYFPPNLVGYFRARHPDRSRLRTRLEAELRARNAARELSRALEILAGWELGMTSEQVASWKDRFLCHVGFLLPPAGEASGTDGSPGALDWMALLEGLSGFDLSAHPASREPRPFLGVAYYAVAGSRIVAASRPSLVEEMIRRGREGEGAATFGGREDVGRMLGRLAVEDEVAFWDFPDMHRVGGGGSDAVTVTLRRLAELLGPMVLRMSPDAEGGEGLRTEANFDLRSRPRTFRLYRSLRQGASSLTLGAYVPADAVLTLLASLDAARFLETLRASGLPAEGEGGAFLGSLWLQALLDPHGPLLEWAAEASVREVAVFANLRPELLVPAIVFGVTFQPPDWGMAFKAAGPVALDGLAARLAAEGAGIDLDQGILDASFPDGRQLAVGAEGDVLLVSDEPETVRSMVEARRKGRSVATRTGFRRLFPEAQRRSKAILVDATQSKNNLLPLLRFVSVTAPPDEFLVGVETLEEEEILRVRVGTVPDLEDLGRAGESEESVVLGAIFGRTPMRRTEEQALGVLLAVREGQRRFRAESRRDADGDGLGEFGSLDDLARAGPGFLPEALRSLPGRLEGEAFGYQFRVDVPADPRRAAAAFASYAWPKEYGVTGVSSFLLREEGPPLRVVSRAYSGPGRGPRPEGALSPPSTWPESKEMLGWLPLF